MKFSDGEGTLDNTGIYVTIINYPIAFTSVFAMGATNGSGHGPHFVASGITPNYMTLGSYIAQTSPSYSTSFGLRTYNTARIKAILVGV